MVVFVTLFYSWANYANVVSGSHEPAAWLAHAEGSALSLAVGDHAHDHGDPLLSAGHDGDMHQHGHNALDHGHDKQNLPHRGATVALDGVTVWAPTAHATMPPSPHFPFERPPRVNPLI
ncbi:MAG: hypothetical protein DWQ11_19950 [Proteobacteria bacterium]|nr:MAG: hypothetical protein DWQ11_19950 [Pseudomonadota bacterium]